MKGSKRVLGAGTSIVIIIIFGLVYLVNWSHVETITASVSKIEKIKEYRSKGTNEKYLVYTDKGIIQEDSDILRDKLGFDYVPFLTEGQTYTFEVSGFHIPFLNSYPNIINATDSSGLVVNPEKKTPGDANQVSNTENTAVSKKPVNSLLKAINKSNANEFYKKANELYANGEFEKAIEYYEAVLTIYPENSNLNKSLENAREALNNK
ncbi:MAG: tetratricopeptide repeat protein [Cyanobacteriota bacterium]